MGSTSLRELVICSLEPWDEVWRRNQFFVDILLRRNTQLRVLFVEPPSDPLHAIRIRKLPARPRFRSISQDGRLWALKPLKPLPRRLGSISDRFLFGQVSLAIQRMSLSHPVLWLNDAMYAPLLRRLDSGAVYDITDDWLLAPLTDREITRLRSMETQIFALADEIVVCSPGLLESRGAQRDVVLIPNAVDGEHLRRPQARPTDLPASPVAVYVGSLHESRLDIELMLELAETLPALNVALVGPDSLQKETKSRLMGNPRIKLLGPRPYDIVPGYLQHADVIIVPHLVNPFTNSLDPIKVYECLASQRPTVATPVAGFREVANRIVVADRSIFVAKVADALGHHSPATRSGSVPSWEERAAAFEEVLLRAQHGAAARTTVR